MQVRTRNAVALVALALVAASCGGETVASQEGTTSSSATSVATEPGNSSAATATIPEILEFEAPLLDGGTFRGVDLAGKDVAFWFWAPW